MGEGWTTLGKEGKIANYRWREASARSEGSNGKMTETGWEREYRDWQLKLKAIHCF